MFHLVFAAGTLQYDPSSLLRMVSLLLKEHIFLFLFNYHKVHYCQEHIGLICLTKHCLEEVLSAVAKFNYYLIFVQTNHKLLPFLLLLQHYS